MLKIEGDFLYQIKIATQYLPLYNIFLIYVPKPQNKFYTLTSSFTD